VETWRKSQMSRELERLLSSQEPSTETMKRKRVDSDVQSTKRLETSTGYQNGSQWQEFSGGMKSQNEFQRPSSPARLTSVIDVSPIFHPRYPERIQYFQSLTRIHSFIPIVVSRLKTLVIDETLRRTS
jgi:hypothetical protein